MRAFLPYRHQAGRAKGRFDPFAASVANDRSRESASSNAPSQPIWKTAIAPAIARSWSRYDILARSKLTLSPRPSAAGRSAVYLEFFRRAYNDSQGTPAPSPEISRPALVNSSFPGGARCGAAAWLGRNRKRRRHMLRRLRRRAGVFECRRAGRVLPHYPSRADA
jgi:hypothetical protein